jgi:polyisoprenoid-binding protein YceI
MATAVGTLELHGQTLPVQMPVTLAMHDGQVSASGQITLELTDYGVLVPSMIKSKITLNAQLVAQPVAILATVVPTSAPTIVTAP